ncbi:DUF1810 family protein [Flavobacterium sp. MAHUQ-51]|uniref:DUF1810 family protein n=1 Tax=Flavobacterium sp. GCM10022190 TaxID=3252639 RepID=UPI00361162DA
MLQSLKGKSTEAIFGDLDTLKLRSCMTPFASTQNANPVFQKVLDSYFSGQADQLFFQF